MAEIVKMPKLSDTMTEGVVSKWHKKVGDKVKSGDLLAEIETDKATMDFESFQDGFLLYIGVEEGKGAPVDSVLAILGKEGEDYKALLAGETAAPVKEEPAAAPAPKEASAPVTAPVAVASPAVASSDNRLKASPLAKKIASDKGIDISQVAGSGDGGRIVKRDVEQFSPAAASAKPAPVFVPAGKESYTDTPVSQMRKVIARRLAESKFSAPHFYLTIEIDMDNAMAARAAINAAGDVKVSFNDFVVAQLILG